MSSKITFYVARHGRTMMNTLDRVQGWCDSPLTKEGREVAQYLGYGLQDIPLRAVYCSDLRRTRETALVALDAAGQKHIPMEEWEGFREVCFGSFEADFNGAMWTAASLFLQYRTLDAMYEDIHNKKISYREALNAIKTIDKMGLAENFDEVEYRTQKALTEIAEKEAKQGDANILVVSHGMSILSMLGRLGGDQLLNGQLDNASICKVIYQDGKFTVESMGDMSYVEKGKAIAQSKNK